MGKPTNQEYKRLKSNFISLSFLQAANYILPLLTLPYLIKILGIENFGLLAFATAVIAYFGILTDYGFNLTATKEISIHRNNPEKITEIFSSVMSIKLILLLLSFTILSAIVFSIELFSNSWQIYLLTFGSIIGQFLFPVWFFQGIEQMKYITLLNLLSKTIFTLAIFILVTKESDIYLVPLLFSIGSIIAGILSLFIIYIKFNLHFKIQKINTIKYYFLDGWHVFLSRLYVSLYSTSNTILLGLMTNNVIVGYYAITEKIVLAIGGISEPVNQTIYPYLAKKYKENFYDFINFLKKMALYFTIGSFILFLLSEYFVDELVYLIQGNYDAHISMLLSIFLFRILLFPFGALLSNTLIIMEEKRRFIKVMNYTVIADVIMVPFAIYQFQERGLIIAFVLTVLVHVTSLYYFTNKSIQEQKTYKGK